MAPLRPAVSHPTGRQTPLLEQRRCPISRNSSLGRQGPPTTRKLSRIHPGPGLPAPTAPERQRWDSPSVSSAARRQPARAGSTKDGAPGPEVGRPCAPESGAPGRGGEGKGEKGARAFVMKEPSSGGFSPRKDKLTRGSGQDATEGHLKDSSGFG